MGTGVTTSESNQLERASVRVAWGAATHVGNVRAVNEDGFLAEPGMWVVADGMGGHSAGSTASEIVIEAFAERVNGEPLNLAVVPSLLEQANRDVRGRAAAEGYETMGATVCGVALVDNGGEDALLVFNVGDSRGYEIVEGGELVQLTTDHSYVQELVEQGEISPKEARTHPARNVVSRAIGIEESVAPDFLVLPRKRASRLLLCSDGVSSELEDALIGEILLAADAPSDAAERLLRQVVEGPARDNATAVVLDVVWCDVEPTHGNGQGLDDTTIPREDTPNPDPSPARRNAPGGQPLIDRIPGFGTDWPVERPSEEVLDNVPTHATQTESDA